MKKLFLFLMLCMTVGISRAQDIAIELWSENQPVVFQCHTESDGGSYGKMTSDQQLEFWEGENGGVDMRLSYDVVYERGRSNSGAYIYHGKRVGNKIVFDTFEDGDAMEYSDAPSPIDKSYMPYEAVINGQTSITWDRCTYQKMTFDLNSGKWIPAK
ncbi:MAG: hypothetical protein K2L83_06575 [Muribaculaceae bacterium]|nr:hypothetical protein [Muribaculaceae bacterium]